MFIHEHTLQQNYYCFNKQTELRGQAGCVFDLDFSLQNPSLTLVVMQVPCFIETIIFFIIAGNGQYNNINYNRKHGTSIKYNRENLLH